jgi:histidinol-phosphatase (PHP family)
LTVRVAPQSTASCLVSVHGGHSGEFCSHANDTLADIVSAYRERGFAWVGITEHMAAGTQAFVPPEEAAAGIDLARMRDRFVDYFATARALQRDFADSMPVLVAFEAEAYSGYEAAVADLIAEHRPDYIVGSVHHVHDVLIDGPKELYQQAIESAGGLEALYCDYFDLQFEILEKLEPEVVGHMDLIRLNDPGYSERLARPEVWARIERNLDVIAEQGAILDVNVRALAKGQPEPYPSRPILVAARERGIAVAPSDDSHGVASVGQHTESGVRLLEELGFDTCWPVPGVARQSG